MFDDVLSQVKPIFIQQVVRGGFVLVDMRFYKNNEGRLILEALVDRAAGGITLDECARLNRELGDIVEGLGSMSADYVCDVSSPGIDRPLVTAADFRRALQKKMRVFLKEMVEGKVEYMGILESMSDDKIWVKLGTITIEIPLNKVNKAKQVIL